MDQFVQIMVFVLSLMTTFLLARIDKWKRWGYIAGLIAQPFWFYSAISSGQMGIFYLSVFNTCFWTVGIYNYWIRKND